MSNAIMIATLGLVGSVLACGQARVPLHPDAITAKRARNIALVHRKEATFVAPLDGGKPVIYPPGAVGILAILVAGLAVPELAAGTQLMKQYNLEDPLLKLGNALATALAEKYALSTKTIIHDKPRIGEDAVPVEDWPPIFEGADLVLSLRGSIWGIEPTHTEGLEGSRYELGYHLRAKLMDTRDQTVVAAGDCKGELLPVQGEPPTYDKMLENDATILKRMTANMIDICLDEYESQLFLTAAARNPPHVRRQPFSGDYPVTKP